jgi:gliding motility-associated transport system ATP-binding protein
MTATRVLLRMAGVVRRRAGRVAVDDLNLSLARGEVLGLLGVNGAGKSTTLAMVAGALRPDAGSIELDGQDFIDRPEIGRQLVGWLPETAPLWPELTVREHLQASASLRGLRGLRGKAPVENVIERLALGPMARRVAGVLSQGQRQRLGLACALLHDPALLVLDEPANALDPVQTAELRTIIAERAAAGCAVILSTHVLAEVTAVCTRAAILHEGRLRHDGSLQSEADRQALETTFFTIATRAEAA